MDQAAILRDYKELRRASIALNTRLTKSLHRDDIGAAAAALDMRRGKEIVLETQDEISVVMDFAIHNIVRDARNAVDRMLENNPPAEGSLELRLLRSMQKSHFTVFEVTTPVPGLGVRGFDGPDKTPTLLVDLGFGQTAVPGAVLAARIHSPGEGWWMTTAALPLSGRALDRMIRDFSDYPLRFGVEPLDRERASIVMRACVTSGASRQIRYAEAGTNVLRSRSAETVVRGEPKIGRNDPCPCGSGKKYKKCCGN